MLAEIITGMSTMILGVFAQYVFGIVMTLTATFLILLVLVQRGRGGGLAGAFGGMGGQSAFGTKAGDAFTKITIGASVFWLLLCIASVRLLGTTAGAFGEAESPQQTQTTSPSSASDEPLLPGMVDSDTVDSDTSGTASVPAGGDAGTADATDTAKPAE